MEMFWLEVCSFCAEQANASINTHIKTRDVNPKEIIEKRKGTHRVRAPSRPNY